MPRKSGTTISPPGTLLTDLRIFMGAYSTCAEVERNDITWTSLENRVTASREWLRFATWAAVCWIIVFWKLSAPSLMDPDEAHYAQLTREMLRAGNWMIPLLDGLPYIDKPVLFHWLQGVAIAALGETPAALRLPSAIAAIALFWVTRWTGVQLFGEAYRRARVADAGHAAADVHAGQHRRVRHGLYRVPLRRGCVCARCRAARLAPGSSMCRTCF